MRHHKMFKI